MPRLVNASLSWVLLQASMFLVAIPIFNVNLSLPFTLQKMLIDYTLKASVREKLGAELCRDLAAFSSAWKRL
jgi:hypothetical protein